MRIPSGVTDQYIYFVAVDSADLKTRETGLSAFTVYRSRNNGAATAMTTPTVAEIDATNMPGVYTLLVDEDTTIDAGDDSQEMAFHITATGMAPVTRTIEIYRPKVTAGETIGVSSGSVTNVTLVATTTTNTDMRGTDGANTTTPPTSAQIADAVWDESLGGHTTAGSAGKALKQIKEGVISVESSVNDLSSTATTFVTNLTETTDGFYHDKVMVFISGTLAGQARHIETYVGSTKSITVSQAFTSAPANADEFLILATHEHSIDEIQAGLSTSAEIAALNDITATDVWAAATRTLTAGTNLNDLSTTDILGMAYEGSEDFQDFLRLMRAVLLGKTTGAGTGTENFRDAGDTKNRVVSSIDANGDRTAITTDAT